MAPINEQFNYVEPFLKLQIISYFVVNNNEKNSHGEKKRFDGKRKYFKWND